MLSRFMFLWSIIIIGLIPSLTQAHGIKPSIVEYRISDKNIEVNLSINAEVFLSGIDASKFLDTANAPEAELYDELRKLNVHKLESKITASINKLKDSIFLKVDQKLLNLNLDKISVQDDESKEKIRITKITFKTTTPKEGQYITFSWKKELGSLIFRDFSIEKDNDGKAYSKWLKAGEETNPIPISGAT